ncbi:MAG: ABC transporter ATP-binding protein/permease [Spirochaetaceae bacterium]
MFKTIKKLKKYYTPYKKYAVWGTMATILFAFLAQIDPYITGQIIDTVLTGKDSNFVIKGSLIILGVTIIRSVVRYGFFISFEKFSQKIVYELRKDLYKKLQSMDFKYFDKTPNGKIMSMMTGDIEAIRHFFAWITHVSVFHSFIFIFAIISMFIINPLLTSTLILIVPFIGFFSLRLSKTVKPMFKNIREQFSKLNTVVQENISGNRVVKAFGREPYEMEKFTVENQGFMDANMDAAKVWEDNLPALDAFAVLFNVIVLFIGTILIINGKMTIGELVAFNRLLWMINNPLRMVGWLINGTQNFIASFDRVKDLIDAKSEISSIKEPINPPQLKGFVSFKNVSFHYEDLPVLDNITFDVSPGETIAILGSTGSGKSTLTSLISRFYDVTEGSITIDGLPISDYEISTLRRNISVAMQDIFLFSDTIEGNIAYGVPNANREKIRMAAEIAGVNEFIYQFEENFNTVVGERGVGLSGGQRQRIALARAIIEDPSILILDDTTSAVDMETEYTILKELKKINSKRTTFIIAHRISSVKDANQILVMDKGKIIERGNHKELIDKKGYYYDVFTQQMGEFDSKIKEGM